MLRQIYEYNKSFENEGDFTDNDESFENKSDFTDNDESFENKSDFTDNDESFENEGDFTDNDESFENEGDFTDNILKKNNLSNYDPYKNSVNSYTNIYESYIRKLIKSNSYRSKNIYNIKNRNSVNFI